MRILTGMRVVVMVHIQRNSDFGQEIPPLSCTAITCIPEHCNNQDFNSRCPGFPCPKISLKPPASLLLPKGIPVRTLFSCAALPTFLRLSTVQSSAAWCTREKPAAILLTTRAMRSPDSFPKNRTVRGSALMKDIGKKRKRFRKKMKKQMFGDCTASILAICFCGYTSHTSARMLAKNDVSFKFPVVSHKNFIYPRRIVPIFHPKGVFFAKQRYAVVF